ncbi:MAG: glycoside hydrolase 100 family protein, partial [Armatimonadota bacterium]
KFLPPIDSTEYQTLDANTALRPHFPLWAYKIHTDDRFDLLGNSLAILSGIASPDRAKAIVTWVETECDAMRGRGELAVDLPPNLFPFILPTDCDWRPRYKDFNMPGDYHNGGIWPFICGFYVVAVLAAGFEELAERKLAAFTELVRPSQDPTLAFGFNEWIRAQDGTPRGNDWQTWSASMYLYAATCVERKQVVFFDEILAHPLR